MSNMETLHDHMILAIYCFLDGKSVLLFSTTCKKIRRILQENERAIWKSVGIRLVKPTFEPFKQIDDRDPFINWRSVFSETGKYERKKWKLNQVFGEDPTAVNLENIITSVEFDPLGQHLAIGYQCGQVVIFKNTTGTTFKFYTQFESHHPEFDFLTSLEIEEKINKIKWVPNRYAHNSRMMLCANDKTIKCWKVSESSPKTLDAKMKGMQLETGASPNGRLPAVPKVTQRKVYSNAHSYNINSLSLCPDGQLFVSADDLRINLWNLEIPGKAYTIVDTKPSNMNELNEVITCAEFHPQNSHNFVWGSSKGAVNVVDTRERAICDRPAVALRDLEPKPRSFFGEVTNSLSDIKWGKEGRYVITRDFLTMKLWDLHYENRPVLTIPVHDHIKPKLYELYENDCIFDKFETCLSPSGLNFLTGSYTNNFLIYSLQSGHAQYLQAMNPRDKKKRKSTVLPSQDSEMNFSEKILHTSWHPQLDLVAISAGNYIFLYHLATPVV